MKKTVLFVQDIPVTLKNEFKAACAKKRMTMKQALILLMFNFTKKKKT